MTSELHRRKPRRFPAVTVRAVVRDTVQKFIPWWILPANLAKRVLLDEEQMAAYEAVATRTDLFLLLALLVSNIALTAVIAASPPGAVPRSAFR